MANSESQPIFEIEGTVFTDKQAERLRRFGHLVDTIATYQEVLDQGKEVNWVQQVGTKKTKIFPVTRDTIYTMKETAFNRYYGELSKDPGSKEWTDALADQ